MSGTIDVLITRLPHGKDLPLPSYHSALAAGLDLIAAVPADKPLTLAPGARALIPTGMRIAQLVVATVARAQLREVESLDETTRGTGGFGSTGG